MKTLGQRVEAYAGDFLSLPGADHLATTWLSTAARSVLRLVEPQHVSVSSIRIPSGGFPEMDIRISSVRVGAWRATPIPSDVIARATNSDSKYGGSAVSPVYYSEDGMVKTYPADGIITGIRLHRYTEGSMYSVPGVSPEAEEAIILDAARHALVHMMKLGAADLDNYNVEVFTPPGTIPDPSFTFTPASAFLAEGRIAEILSLAHQYNELAAIFALEDIELASAKMQEIQTRIAEFRANIEAASAELQANAQRQTDVSIRNAVEELGRQVQEYTLRIRKLEIEAQVFVAKNTGQAQLISALTQRAQTIVDEKSKRYLVVDRLYTQRMLLLGAKMATDNPKEAAA